MGPEIAPPPPRCATQPPKRASGNERPLKPGGAGGHPPRLFASGLSPRESLDPPPGTGRGTTSQVLTCDGPNETTCQGQHGAAYPLGGCLGSHPWSVAPRAPARSRAGTHLAGLDLRRSKPGPPAAPAGPPILLPSYQKAGQMTTSGNGWPAGSRPGRRFLAC